MAVDPVCGMTVDPARAAGNFDHGGTTYYFCSKGCLAKFAADPEKYLSGAKEPMAPAAPAELTIGGLKKPHAREHEASASAASVSESPLRRDRREHEAREHPAPSTHHVARDAIACA